MDSNALDLAGWDWAQILSSTILIVDYTIKVIAIGVVPENRRPSSSSAWLLLILFLPLVGIPLFLLLGSPYITGRREKIQEEANTRLRQGTADIPDWPEALGVPEMFGGLVTLNRNLTYLPMVTGTDHGVRTDYEENIRVMAEAIDAADDYVDVCMYIMTADSTTEPFLAALERAAGRGVTVRVLFDHLGSRPYAGFRPLMRRLDAAGIEWSLMLPFQPLRGRMRRVDLRNHRKLMVVDGTRAFMGSMNMIEASYGSARNAQIGRLWHDIMVELTGPVVASLEAVFVTDWFTEKGEDLSIRAYDDEERLQKREAAIGQRLTSGKGVSAARESAPATVDGAGAEASASSDSASVTSVPSDSELNAVQVIPSGPGFRTHPNLRLFVSLVYLAQERLRIVSPYFVPDESMLAAVITAAHRGVEVELYVSEQADQFMVDHAQSSYYEALLEAGVRIYRYPAPKVLHTKCFTVDDLCSVMGSSNMDMRSFGLNYEVSLLAYGGDITESLHGIMDEYRSVSSELTEEEWEQRPWGRRWLDSAMRLTSALQ
ncbi:phospholipase D-like domain-containing protein [Brevibacterium jeotgali]|uniref:phospholipase D-like domain-containing protein n=1 Tax=Brevibacterium jeotgali TaxID=1262550 RepID=UPI000C769012|nr:phospholipase D-like domain-containing protein [Brevibacterium jeotgali]